MFNHRACHAIVNHVNVAISHPPPSVQQPMYTVPLFLLAFTFPVGSHLWGLSFSTYASRGKGVFAKCVHSKGKFIITMTSYCVQGGGVQKCPKIMYVLNDCPLTLHYFLLHLGNFQEFMQTSLLCSKLAYIKGTLPN